MDILRDIYVIGISIGAPLVFVVGVMMITNLLMRLLGIYEEE